MPQSAGVGILFRCPRSPRAYEKKQYEHGFPHATHHYDRFIPIHSFITKLTMQITVQDVHAKLQAGEPLLLLDVRNPEEYAICKLDGSQLISLGELVGRIGEIEVGSQEPIIVYCHHGVRSLHAAMFLKQSGFENVLSMTGGIDAWSMQIDPAVKRY